MNDGSDGESATRTRRWLRVAIVAVLAMAGGVYAVMLSGCNFQECQEVQNNYEDAVNRESGFIELDEDGPPHLAMALSMDFVNDLSSRALEKAIGDALGTGGTLDLGGGQSATFSMEATGADLNLDASPQCGGCVRVSGDFDGAIQASLPGTSERSSALSGSMSWVIPLDVARDGDEIAIFFDTQQAVQMGLPSIDAWAGDLSDTWEDQITAALNELIADRVVSRFEPVRLTGYEMPEFGLEGLEFAPTLFSLEDDTNTLILGLRTNTDVRDRHGSPQDVVDALSLDGGNNVALAIQPGFVTELVRIALYEKIVPRRYSLSGRARADGPARVVADNFDVGPHTTDSDALELGLDFRVFCFDGGLGCFSVGALSRSRFAIEDGQMAFDVEEVEFTDAGYLSDVANWASAEFVEHTQGVVRRSLDDDVVTSDEDSDVDVRGERVRTEAGLLILSGVGSSE